MDKKVSHPPHKHLRLAYILISVVLFLPVLLWPLPILIFENPMLADLLLPTWLLCVALLLITSVTMDSMLYGLSNFKQVIDATLWVSFFAMIIISTLQKQDNAWLLGVFFLIHSLRAAFFLLKLADKKKDWWLWLSWGRDTITATIIFFWVTLLG